MNNVSQSITQQVISKYFHKVKANINYCYFYHY